MPLVALASRRLRLPYTVALVLVGLAFSIVPIAEAEIVSPGLVVAVLLPGLVFDAAYRLDGDELRRTFGGVALLAVPGVLVTAAIVALVLHLATGLPPNEAFLVGAIVSATDPVAVVSTMRRLSAPRRLVTLVDAESLFNDGTAALAFVIALAAFGPQPPTLAEDAFQFAIGLFGSVAIGAAAGFAISRMLRATDDHLIELTLTLLAAYGTYLVADLLHESGIIASVVAGIVLGTYGRRAGMSRRAEEAIDVVWEFLAFVLTGAAFLLIGLAIPLATLAVAAVAIAWGVLAVLAGRAVVVYGLLGGSARLAQPVRVRPSLPLVLAPRHELDRPARGRRDRARPVDPGERPRPRAAPGNRVRDRPVHADRPGDDGRARASLGRGPRGRRRARERPRAHAGEPAQPATSRRRRVPRRATQSGESILGARTCFGVATTPPVAVGSRCSAARRGRSPC